MARYLVLAQSFINNSLVNPGEEVDFDGDAGPNLQLIKKSKKSVDAPAEPPADAPAQDDAALA